PTVPNLFPRGVSLDCDGGGIFTGTQAGVTGAVALQPSGSLTFDQPFSGATAVIRASGLPASCQYFSLNYVVGAFANNFSAAGTDADGAFGFNFNFPAAAQG